MLQFWTGTSPSSGGNWTSTLQDTLLQYWVCPHCRQTIYGSLDVVLALVRQHACAIPVRTVIPLTDTQCLDCLLSPTGVCERHAASSERS